MGTRFVPCPGKEVSVGFVFALHEHQRAALVPTKGLSSLSLTAPAIGRIDESGLPR